MIGTRIQPRIRSSKPVDTRKSIMRYLLVCLLLGIGSVSLLCAYLGIPLELVMAALAGLAVAAYFVIRFPEWFLAAALFAPQWKTFWIFKSLDKIGDLTVIMLLCLAAGLIWRYLMPAGRSHSWSLQTILNGQSAPLLAFLAFAAIVALSYTYTDAPSYGASKLFRFLLIGSLLLISPFFLIMNESNFRRFALIFVGFSAATAMQLVFALEFRVHDDSVDVTRIGAGWLMGMSIILVLFYPLARSRRQQRAIYLFVLPLLIAGLVASVARGPMVALFLVSLLGLAVWLKQGRLRAHTAMGLLILTGIGFAGSYYALSRADLDKYTAKLGEFETLASRGSSSGSAGKRLNFYRATLPAIADHPVLGKGVGSWAVFYYGNDSRNYPHNLLLEIAFEEGLVGLGAFFVLLFLVGTSTVWLLRASKSQFLALGLMVLYCVTTGLFSGDLDDNRVLWIWVGMTLAICRNVRLQMLAGSFARRFSCQPADVHLPSDGVSAYSARSAGAGTPIPRRSRAWREKFVY